MNLVIPYLKVVSPMVLGCLGQRGFKQPAVKNRPNANTRKQKAFCPLPSAFWLLVLITPSAVRAQIVPDNTLPVNSQVTGCPVCTIDGGTVRGVNLFHSFQEFGVPTGGEAFFNNGLDIENILGRVTGTNISDIDGWIRANGTANLFLINPNGIVFGENARLDVGGSFVASTANAIGFGNQGVFSATEPEAPPLLTVNPDVLFFNQLAAQGVSSIEVRGSLSVPSGESLLLVGGNVAPDATTTGEVLIDGGTLTAPGGRVELAGVGAPGEVELVVNQSSLGLNFPADLARTDISIFGSTIDVREAGGGDIVISPRDLSIENSQLFAGIASSLGSVDAQAGDITIDATGTVAVAEGVIRNNVQAGAIGRGGDVKITASSVSLTNGAQIGTSTRGEGDAGKVVIRAMDSILLDGEDSQGRVSGVGNQVNRGAKGNSGGVEIESGSLSVTNGAFISGSTFEEGDAGKVVIRATDSILLDGESRQGFRSAVFNQVNRGAKGNSGGVEIESGSLSVTNRARISASTFGEGDAGKVVIRATDNVLLDGESRQGIGSIIESVVASEAQGDSGGVEIESGSLSLMNGAFINASTLGEGDAGKVVIQATDSILLDGENSQGFRSAVFSRVNSEAQVDSGGVEIESGSLFVTNGAFINASTLGEGDAGKVVIRVTDSILLDGEDSQGFGSSIGSQVAPGAKGNSGGVEIESGSLSLMNGTRIDASTLGEGDAGKVVIRATDSILLDGENSQGFGSGVLSGVAPGAQGNSGGVEIESGSLSLTNGAGISASTWGEGDAGKVVIRATDSILLDGENSQGFASGVFSAVESEAKGNSGGVEIESGSLSLTNGAQISASTFGEGDAGKVVIRATDNVFLDGESTQGFLSLVFSTVELEAKGNSGGVEIESGSLSLTNGAQISASTWGEGDAGKVVIRATDNVFLDGESTQGFLSSVLSGVTPEAQGNSRGVEIESGSLSLTNGARITAETQSTGMAGDVRLNVTDFIQLSGDSTIRANATAGGSAGNITLTTPELTLENGANIATTTESSGKAGNITLQSHPTQENLTINLAPETSISASTNSPFNQATGGDIKIKAPDAITIQGEGTITTETAGAGQAGNIEITSTDLNIQQTELSTSTTGEGNAGNITLDTSTLTLARGAKIFAFTEGSGDSGTIEINAPTEVNLGIGVDDFSPVLSVETSRAGKAGNIIVNTPTLTLSDTARITATATDTATNTEGGGSITLNASTMNLAGIVGVFAETEGQTPAGTLTLNPYLDESTLDITLAPNSQVSASTSGSGTGGNLILSAPQAITIAGQGRLGTCGKIEYQSL